ncbi:MAG: DNA helicase RecG, partial [bacterium]|nr:DNA helicase RecG [bacterium]
VGRGSEQSYCLLVGEAKTPEAVNRIAAMLETNDGFKIAERDLQIRGPGEFFGVRQHGLPEFKIADVVHDFALLSHAREMAFALVREDPYLRQERCAALKNFMRDAYGNSLALIQVG